MRKIFVVLVVCTLLLNGCTANKKYPPKTLRLTTTTSVNDSGLLEYLRPFILEEANINLEIVSLGSGAALEAGKRGDADALLVHSPVAERIFVDEGYGIKRSTFMYNFFVIIGPSSDPAQIGYLSAAEALKKIESLKLPFISRGDNSGTHNKKK
ncbi:MAG: substrate-binding domain-containing protein [Erysipelothrix sp.]|nr:substrate-binding domain-containing protein [Erysipelothrix sp.]